MKKISIIAILLLAFSLVSTAENVTFEKAEAYAERFFFGEYATKDYSIYLTPVGNRITPPYYIFNRNGGGFILVSGVDSMDPVIGYSLTGSFNPDDLPFALETWLEQIDKTANHHRKNRIVASYETQLKWKTVSTRATVGEGSYYSGVGGKQLDTPQWNQGTPFNDKCPKKSDGIKNCPCGCVATAMAELMRFYEWPDSPADTVLPEYTYSKNKVIQEKDLTDRTYNFSEMPLTIWEAMNSSDIVKDNIATLLSDIGHSVCMSYGDNGSGAYSSDIVAAMGGVFKYNKKARLRFRSDYSTQQWIEMMKQSIDEGHPVLISGNSSDGGGHEFIVDGYDDNLLMRFNFGWGTSYNGYWAIGANEYAYDSDAVFDLYPDKENATEFGNPELLMYYLPDYGGGLELAEGYDKIENGKEFKLTFSSAWNAGPVRYDGYARYVYVNKDETEYIPLCKPIVFSLDVDYLFIDDGTLCLIDREPMLGDKIIFEYTAGNSPDGPWTRLPENNDGYIIYPCPAVKAAFIDIPANCSIGEQYELRLKNASYCWGQNAVWYVTSPDGETHAAGYGYGSMECLDRNVISFTESGNYRIKVVVTNGNKTVDSISTTVKVN